MTAWIRASLVAATTFASSFTFPGEESKSCAAKTSLQAACASSDAHVELLDVFAPLALAAGAVLWSYLPTLLLSSRRRAHRLSIAAGHVALVWASAPLLRAAHDAVSPSFAYALSLHLAVTLMSQRRSDSLLLFLPSTHSAVRIFANGCLVVGACFGPPFPAFDSPGVPGCCGATSHLAAWIIAETAGDLALWLLLDWRAEL